MNRKMTIWGIGPKLVSAALLYFILTYSLSLRFPSLFMMGFVPKLITKGVGIILLSIGILFFISTQIVFLREFGKGKLITSGTYSMCRNPIYATFIVFIIPAIAMLTNSWLSITTSILMYTVFKANIGKEYDYLREAFGEEYLEYEKRVNEIIPIPKRHR